MLFLLFDEIRKIRILEYNHVLYFEIFFKLTLVLVTSNQMESRMSLYYDFFIIVIRIYIGK